MQRIGALVVLCLFIGPLAFAEEPKKPQATTPPAGTLVKMDAEEVFAFVEQALKDPKLDRKKVLAFLQKGLDGQVRMLEVETTETRDTVCVTKRCKAKLCKRCDLNSFSCFCSNCCVAVQP